MLRIRSTMARSALSLAAAVALSWSPAAAQSTGVTNIILVHGAWADGSSWGKVIPLLEARGLNVVSVQNPLTSLADDVAATKRAIAAAKGPVLLVGHSWGGTVICEAGMDPKVAGLVFVSSAEPDVGQSLGDLAAAYPTPVGQSAVRADPNGYLTLTTQGVVDYFAADLPKPEALLVAATQGDTNSAVFSTKLTNAAWHTKPNFVVIPANDKMIQPDLERASAAKIHATTLELQSSHVAMLSHPVEVAKFIADAAASVKLP